MPYQVTRRPMPSMVTSIRPLTASQIDRAASQLAATQYQQPAPQPAPQSYQATNDSWYNEYMRVFKDAKPAKRNKWTVVFRNSVPGLVLSTYGEATPETAVGAWLAGEQAQIKADYRSINRRLDEIRISKDNIASLTAMDIKAASKLAKEQQASMDSNERVTNE